MRWIRLPIFSLSCLGCAAGDTQLPLEGPAVVGDGPVFVRPVDGSPNSTVPAARAVGVLRVEDECVYLDAPDGLISYLVIWPNSAEWKSSDSAIVWSRGMSLNGAQIDAPAAFVLVEELGDDVFPGIESYSGRCEDVIEVVLLY